MKALSCAIIFLACILAFWLIGEEEIRKGYDLVGASRVFGFIAIIAFYEWWKEMHKP